MKRQFTTLLILTFLLLADVSCGSASEADDGTTAAAASDSAEETTESLYTDLGEYDFGGRSFTIVYSEEQLGSLWPYEADEQNGDIVNDAVYERNTSVGEKYNAEIIYEDVGGLWDEVGNALLKSVMSGENAYDLAITHMFAGINQLVSSKALYNFNDLPVVNYDKPWWAQHLRDTLEADGVLLLNVSDLVYNFNDCIFFNKQILEDYQIDADLYQLVRDSKWTWDKLIGMAKSVSSDLNGDSKFDENDMYGYAMVPNSALDSNWVYANGMTMAAVENGKISLESINSERMRSVVDFMNDLVNIGNQTYISTSSDLQDTKIFLDGHSLFMENVTTVLPGMRDSELDFGIVPLPKYDEAQSDYYARATTQMLALPATLDDPVFTGVILEALSMESHRIVNPKVYEISFSGKYLRDEESYEMYQIIADCGVYDFNWTFGSGNTFAYIMRDLIRSGVADTLSSYYQSNRDKVQKLLDDVLADIMSYNE